MNILRIASNFIKNKFAYAGVPVIIQNSKGEILLGKRSNNHISYPGFWGLPGGMIDYGESLETTAKREVWEELGVKVKITKRSKNVYENLPNKYIKSHAIDIPFYAKIIKGIPKPKDETSKVGWFKSSEIKKMKLAYSHLNLLKGEGLIK